MIPTEARIVGTVHDSGLFEVRKDKVKIWTKHIKHVMENLPLKKKFGCVLSVPIIADMKIGSHWGENEETKV
jgi:DNA polymerase I-like protein with 3'-5' exonuclease and polymerase domains